MSAKIKKEETKHFFIQSYGRLWQLERAIELVKKISFENVQISVLGKVSQKCILTDKVIRVKEELKMYWKESLGVDSDFGIFCNPEMGTLFIAGNLVSQFLHDIDGNILGEMSSGPYGIFRGLGIGETDTAKYLKLLNNYQFLLILRGNDQQLDVLKLRLMKSEKSIRNDFLFEKHKNKNRKPKPPVS